MDSSEVLVYTICQALKTCLHGILGVNINGYIRKGAHKKRAVTVEMQFGPSSSAPPAAVFNFKMYAKCAKKLLDLLESPASNGYDRDEGIRVMKWVKKQFPLLYEARTSKKAVSEAMLDLVAQVEATVSGPKLCCNEQLPTDINECLAKIEDMKRNEEKRIEESRDKINDLIAARNSLIDLRESRQHLLIFDRSPFLGEDEACNVSKRARH